MAASSRKPWAREFTRWTHGFIAHVKLSHEARRAWKLIQQHSPRPASGLVGQAALLLWLYAGGARREFGTMHAQSEENARLLKAAIRAEHSDNPIKHERGRPRKDPRQLRLAALASPFTDSSDGPATVGEAVARVERETRKALSLGETKAALVRSTGARSQYNEKFFLAVLQELAASHGLRLGFKSLAALARCANEAKYQGIGSERNLQDYLRNLWPDARPTIRTTWLPSWRRHVIPREEFPHLFASLR